MSPAATADDLVWQPSYLRASLDQFLAEAEVERMRLLKEIEVIEERVRIAQAGRAKRVSAARGELGSMALAVQAEIARMEQEHEHAVTESRAAAVAEAERLRAAARAEAAALAHPSGRNGSATSADTPTAVSPHGASPS